MFTRIKHLFGHHTWMHEICRYCNTSFWRTNDKADRKHEARLRESIHKDESWTEKDGFTIHVRDAAFLLRLLDEERKRHK